MTVSEKDKSVSGGIRTNNHSLHYRVNDIPSLGGIVLFGFQQMMICISGLLVVPFLVSEIACAGTETITLRVRLIASTFVTSGIATLVQTTLGLRLCILHGPSFAFLPPLIAFSSLPENQCLIPKDQFVPEEQWTDRILTIQGSLLLSVLPFLLFGSTGLVGRFARFVGPVTICPLLILLTLGTMPTLAEKMALHWISVVEFCILICLGVFLEHVHVPIPYISIREKKIKVLRLRIFGQFPYLIGISLAWFLCYLLTISDLEPPGGEARTDKNATLSVIHSSPWFQFPYPGQFGFPRVSLGLFLGFLASTFACMMESVGDYGMCAKVSQQRHPPSASINRAIICEGFGALLAASMGVGTGVTTYAENIALMHVTKVASRITMQLAGVLLILLGLFTKCAALLASIPDAVVGGILAMGMAMISGVALSNLQFVDLRLSRNLTIMGTSILVGCVVPYHVEHHPIQTGSRNTDQVLNMLLGIRMLVGGLVAFLLDNAVGGATPSERGFPSEDNDEKIEEEQDGYALPMLMENLLSRYPILSRLPFLPSIPSNSNTVSPSSSPPSSTIQTIV